MPIYLEPADASSAACMLGCMMSHPLSAVTTMEVGVNRLKSGAEHELPYEHTQRLPYRLPANHCSGVMLMNCFEGDGAPSRQ